MILWVALGLVGYLAVGWLLALAFAKLMPPALASMFDPEHGGADERVRSLVAPLMVVFWPLSVLIFVLSGTVLVLELWLRLLGAGRDRGGDS